MWKKKLNVIISYKNVWLRLLSKENIKEPNPKWPEIPDHLYRILMIGGSGSGEKNTLLILINNEPHIEKIYLYAKDPYEVKYQLLINK